MRTRARLVAALAAAAAVAVAAAPGTAQAGFLLQPGERMYAGAADNPCTTGFFVTVAGERSRMMLTAGTCGEVGAPVFHRPGLFRYGVVTANASAGDGVGTSMDAAMFRTEYRAHGAGARHIGGRIVGVAEERELMGAAYERSGQSGRGVTGTVGSVQTIGGQRHYCGGPALGPGDKGGPVVLRAGSSYRLRAAGIATATGSGGEMCFLPIRAVLEAFDATLVTFPDPQGGRR